MNLTEQNRERPEKNPQPHISVIVPVYKVEKYLKRCVDSILSQTYKSLEIILVDDGSPDNSGRICDEYSLSDNRVKVIHKSNGGLSDARNAGIDMATGDYIGFVDSDDFIHPGMYETLLSNLEKYGADIAQCSFRTVSGDQPVDPGDMNDCKKVTPGEALNIIYTPFGVDYVVAWNKLYKKSLFSTIRFPVSKIHEDEFTTWKLFYNSASIVVTGAKYYYYFQSPDSITRSSFSEKKLHFAEAMEERIRFFSEKGFEDLHTIALKKYALWLLYFYYRFYWSLTKRTGTKRKIASTFRKVEEQLHDMQQVPARLKIILRFSRHCLIPAGFLVYQQMFRRNVVGRIAEILEIK